MYTRRVYERGPRSPLARPDVELLRRRRLPQLASFRAWRSPFCPAGRQVISTLLIAILLTGRHAWARALRSADRGIVSYFLSGYQGRRRILIPAPFITVRSGQDFAGI